MCGSLFGVPEPLDHHKETKAWLIFQYQNEKRLAERRRFLHSGIRMKSMTGYGRGECAQDGFKITVEVSSVNRRQSEVVVYTPRELELLESQLRDEINHHISRGRLTVRVTLHAADKVCGTKIRLNIPLAKAYGHELERLAKELRITGPVTLDHILRAPGVVQTEEGIADAEDFWPPMHKALREALQQMLRMREREGAHLEKDLRMRMGLVRKIAARIQKYAPRVVRLYQHQLLARIRQAGIDHIGINDPRILQEIAFFADRSDISEELTRLQSHFQQFEDCLQGKEPIGRTLDFLAQEMNREVNTIGSKANDSRISREVVQLKAELEKFREQVQNVE
jgi:uncharacterized protein (TIGR00255 family)